MNNYEVIALDPGGTTGLAGYRATKTVENGKAKFTEPKFYYTQLGPDVHHLDLFSRLEKAQATVNELHVVCESFEFRQRVQDAKRTNIVLMSRNYIGVVELFEQMHPDVKVRYQTASIGKGFVDDRKLKIMNLYIPGKVHARDAMRHLISYLVQKQHRHDLIRSWTKL